MTDQDLGPVFSHCRLLKQLHVSVSAAGGRVTDLSISLIARLLLLVELDLVGLAHVTDAAVVSIARNCTRLEVTASTTLTQHAYWRTHCHTPA